MYNEVYYSKERTLKYTDDEFYENVLASIEKMNVAIREDIEVIDVRHINYVNVIFYKGMERHRDNVLDI